MSGPRKTTEKNTIAEQGVEVNDPAGSRSRLAFYLILVIFFSLGLLACWYTFLAYRRQETQLWHLTYITWLVFSISGLSFTRWVKTFTVKFFFLLSLFSLEFILTSSLVENTGIVSGIIILSFALFLAASIFRGKKSSASITTGIILAMVASLIDIFSPFKQSHESMIVYALLAGLAALLATFSILVIRKIIVLSIQIKLVATSFIVLLIPILALSFIQAESLSNAITASVHRSLELGASQTAEKFDQFFASNRQAIMQGTALPEFTDYLSLAAAERPGSQAERALKITFDVLQKRTQANLISYGLLDAKGSNIFDTIPTNVGQNEASNSYFQSPFAEGQIFISGITFTSNDGTPVIYFSNPVMNIEGKTIGVLRAIYDANGLQNIAEASTGLTDGRAYPVLIDEKSARVADTLTSNFLLKPGNSPFDPGVPIISATATMKEKPWTVIYVQEQSVLEQLVKKENQSTILLATLFAGFVCLLAVVFSRSFAHPILSLTKYATKISDGDFNITVPVTTQDEIGTLTYAFNLMTDQVRTSINELENRVRSRTSELEAQNRNLRSRTKQIQAIADVARSIASSQDPDKLLAQIASTISDRCSFYHVGIFLLDKTKEYAELRAANSEGGKKMIARGHKLPVGKVGIVGYVAATGKPRIAFDVGEDATHFKNPDLPQTMSEMALPLVSSGDVIGVLDVQSETRDAFSQDDIELFHTLADQVAIAIVNSRLYQEAVQSLEESQKLHRQYLREEWSKLASEKPIIGYQYSSSQVTPLFMGSINEDEEYPPHADSNSTVILEENGRRTTVLKIPITLRGEVIGTIDLKDDQGVNWDAEAVATARSVGDQISQALENARLFEQTQRRAERERKVLEITSRIRSTTDPDAMLQIAAAELQKALSARVNIVSLRLTEPTYPDKPGNNGHHGIPQEAENG
jgi:GAF domain-containing protein/HAMP domain-containing protein